MKKLTFLAALAIAAVTMTSCSGGAPKANLKSDVDSLSYAMGLSQTDGLKQYLAQTGQLDTAYIDAFIKGMVESANAGDNKKQAAYYAGIQIGQQIANNMVRGLNYQLFEDDSTRSVSLNNILAGIVTGLKGKKGIFTQEEANAVADRLMQSIKAGVAAERYSENKAAGEKFMAENAKKEGVVTLPSGVQYKILKEGKGAIPADSSTVTMHYEGRLINDSVFDSSYKRNQPYTVRCNQNIKGFTEALTHMPAGSIWEVYIPQELAYGERQAGAMVKPFSALIFKIELIEVK